MTTLATDRSTDVATAAVSRDGEVLAFREFPLSTARSADWLSSIADFVRETVSRDSAPFAAIDRFVCGLGPGSFTGVRATLAAFAGLALPKRKTVCGLTSALAYSRDGEPIAVAGDARRGRFWTILFEGAKKVRDFALCPREELRAAVPDGFKVFSPDDARAGTVLAGEFGSCYLGGGAPSAARLAQIAETHAELLCANPLPVYLMPAVRPPEPPRAAQ